MLRHFKLFAIRSLVSAVAIVVVIYVLALTQQWADNERYQNVKHSFRGISRSEAYARLHRMWLTAMPYDRAIGSYIGPAWPAKPATWRATGDVSIEFEHVSRRAPTGTCGAYPIVVLHFRQEHVAGIVERIMPLACL